MGNSCERCIPVSNIHDPATHSLTPYHKGYQGETRDQRLALPVGHPYFEVVPMGLHYCGRSYAYTVGSYSFRRPRRPLFNFIGLSTRFDACSAASPFLCRSLLCLVSHPDSLLVTSNLWPQGASKVSTQPSSLLPQNNRLTIILMCPGHRAVFAGGRGTCALNRYKFLARYSPKSSRVYTLE